MTAPRPAWLPSDDVLRVTVSATARFHGRGPQALPSRRDAEGTIAAILVEEEQDAHVVFRALDVPGRTIHVDVERKQAVDLMGIAVQEVRHAALAHTKPNDATVDALDVTVTHLYGPDLRSLVVGIIGTGNLGFKTALRLAERNADVLVSDRDPDKALRVVQAINGMLPRFQSRPVRLWHDEHVDLMLTAVTSVQEIGAAWLPQLRSGAVVIDMGINNLGGDLVAAALARSVKILRLDTRASSQHIPRASPRFFEDYFGESELEGVPLVSGGVVGRYGQVVVDSHVHPTEVIGLANGFGALVPDESLTEAEKALLASVRERVHAQRAAT